MTVMLGARNHDRGMEAQNKLVDQRLDVSFVHLDVTDPTIIQNAVTKIQDMFGRLDVLVNKARIMVDPETKLLEVSTELFHNTLETNTLGPLLLCQACVPIMKTNRYGRIVNVSSSLGSLTEIANPDSFYGQVRSPAYRLSKILLNGITVLLAKELHGTNILVNSVCPGWAQTQLGGGNADPTVQGADTPVWLATLPDDGPTGGFFREHQAIPW